MRMSGSSPAARARRAADPFSRRVTSSDSSSSRKSACGSLFCRARVSRSGRVARSWPSLRVRRCRLRSGLTGSARVIGCPFMVLFSWCRCRAARRAGAGAVPAAAVIAVPGGGGRCCRAGSFRSGVVGGLRAGRVLAAGDEVVQEAGEAVLLGALAVQGGLGAGELLAQRGDGVVRGGQLRCGGGELGGVPLLVVPRARAASRRVSSAAARAVSRSARAAVMASWAAER